MAANLQRRALIALSVAGVGLAWRSSAGAEEADLLAALAKQFEKYPVLRAGFVQTRQLAHMKRPVVSRGKVAFSRREGVIWLVATPVEMSYWLGETRMIERTADGQQREQSLQDSPALTSIGKTLRALLAGQTEVLAETFRIKAQGQISDWRLELTPKSETIARHLQRVTVQGGQFVRVLTLEETSGDITRIEYLGTEVFADAPLAEAQRFAVARP